MRPRRRSILLRSFRRPFSMAFARRCKAFSMRAEKRFRIAFSFSLRPAVRHRSRVGGGAQSEDRAGLRPPLKLHVQFSRMQLSARALSWRTRLKVKFQQAYQPQLAI